MKITQQAFNEWVRKYYNEVMEKINNGELCWLTFGRTKSGDNNRKKGIIIVSTKTGKIARSYRHSSDEWDIRVGLAVAYARYMGVEIPQVEKTYLVTELVGKEIMIDGNRYYITPYGNKYSIYAIDESGRVYHLSKARVVFEYQIILKKEQ